MRKLTFLESLSFKILTTRRVDSEFLADRLFNVLLADKDLIREVIDEIIATPKFKIFNENSYITGKEKQIREELGKYLISDYNELAIILGENPYILEQILYIKGNLFSFENAYCFEGITHNQIDNIINNVFNRYKDCKIDPLPDYIGSGQVPYSIFADDFFENLYRLAYMFSGNEACREYLINQTIKKIIDMLNILSQEEKQILEKVLTQLVDAALFYLLFDIHKSDNTRRYSPRVLEFSYYFNMYLTLIVKYRNSRLLHELSTFDASKLDDTQIKELQNKFEYLAQQPKIQLELGIEEFLTRDMQYFSSLPYASDSLSQAQEHDFDSPADRAENNAAEALYSYHDEVLIIPENGEIVELDATGANNHKTKLAKRYNINSNSPTQLILLGIREHRELPIYIVGDEATIILPKNMSVAYRQKLLDAINPKTKFTYIGYDVNGRGGDDCYVTLLKNPDGVSKEDFIKELDKVYDRPLNIELKDSDSLLSAEEKSRLRLEIQEAIEKGKSVNIGPRTLSQLLFEYDYVDIQIADGETERMLRKSIVWSGSFLRSIDLRNISFDDVDWDVSSETYAMRGIQRIDLSHTNAQIFFSTSYNSKYSAITQSNKLIFNRCNLEGVELGNNELGINDEQIELINCNFSSTNLKIDSENHDIQVKCEEEALPVEEILATYYYGITFPTGTKINRESLSSIGRS